MLLRNYYALTACDHAKRNGQLHMISYAPPTFTHTHRHTPLLYFFTPPQEPYASLYHACHLVRPACRSSQPHHVQSIGGGKYKYKKIDGDRNTGKKSPLHSLKI